MQNIENKIDCNSELLDIVNPNNSCPLPFELIPLILVETDNQTLFTCFCVCVGWNSFSDDNYLFKSITKRRYNLKNYKKYFIFIFNIFLLIKLS